MSSEPAVVRPSAAAPRPALAPTVAAVEVTRRYGEGETGVDALRGVSLAVARGEVVAVMGPSGSGKSTLLHILAGLDRPTSGEAFIDGVALSTHARPAADVAAAPQGRVRVPVLQPAADAERRAEHRPAAEARRARRPTWMGREVIDSVGLGARRAHRPAELSGGQQQRVAIARALITRPSVLFADEPTGNLDSKAGREVLELLRSCASSFGQTILTVTHEPRVSSIADRILLLADGLIVDELDHVSSGGGEERDRRARDMTGVVLGGLATRKLRAALTAIAIVLGVAMISGTYVLMDTTMHAFDNLFTTAYSKAGAVVVGKTPIAGAGASAPPVPAALAARIRALPQVQDAQGFIDDKAQIRDAQGGAINGPGSPIALSVPGRGSTLNTLQLVSGRFPTGPVRSRSTSRPRARTTSASGRRSASSARHPLQLFRVVGLVRFGGVGVARADAAAGVRPTRRPAAVRQAGPLRRDRRLRPPRGQLAAARARDRAAAPGDRAGQDGAPRRCRRRPSTSRRAWRSSATCCSRSAGSRCSSARS